MKLHPFITIDFPRKFASLLCAGAICYFVHKQIQEEEVFRDIPVTFKHSEDLVILKNEVQKINVKLRGPKRRLKNLTNADIKIIGQISDQAISGRYTVLLREKNIEIPRNLNIIEITPDSLIVHVDTVKTIEGVPIRCRFTGQLPEGYGRKNFQVLPKTAGISGPSGVVSDIKELVTNAIELDRNIHEDFEVEVPLLKIPQLSISPETVKVTVELYKMKDSKFFNNLDISIMENNSDLFFVEQFVNPINPKIEAVLGGPKSTIDIITSSSLRPFIDISDISKSGIYKLPVHLWVDAKDCKALEIKPMIVEVKMSRKQ